MASKRNKVVGFIAGMALAAGAVTTVAPPQPEPAEAAGWYNTIQVNTDSRSVRMRNYDNREFIVAPGNYADNITKAFANKNTYLRVYYSGGSAPIQCSAGGSVGRWISISANPFLGLVIFKRNLTPC